MTIRDISLDLHRHLHIGAGHLDQVLDNELGNVRDLLVQPAWVELDSPEETPR